MIAAGPAQFGYITDQSVINMNSLDTAHRRRRKDARPQELLEAALAVFVEKGFSATRIDEVAQRAGVSKGTLYLYYTSKEDLLKAVIAEHLSDRIAEGAAMAAGFAGDTTTLLRELLVGWWSQLYDSPASGVFKLVITEVRNFPEIAEFYAREVVEPGMDVIGQLLQRGMAQGEFRSDLNIMAAVHSVVLPMIMLCLHKHSLGPCACIANILPEPRQLIRSHMALLLQGLQNPASPKTRRPR